MTCIVERYIEILKKFINDYFKVVLGNDYEKAIITPFIETFIEIRYCNNKSFLKESSFLALVNKEIKPVATSLIENNPEREEVIKNICVLMMYIFYVDGCFKYSDTTSLVNILCNDHNLKLKIDARKKYDVRELFNEFIEKKNKLLNTFNINDFKLKEKRIAYKVYEVDLIHTMEINQLYSTFAIDRAYEAPLVIENKVFLLYLLLSGTILKEANELDFSKKYIVPLPNTLIKKDKKINILLKVIDSPVLKNRINIKISYTDYRKNCDIIKKYIKMGYQIALEIDETFDNDLDNLVLFNYVIVHEKYDYSDYIIENADLIETNLIII